MHLTLVHILTLVSLKRTIFFSVVSPPDSIIVRTRLINAWDQTFTVCHFLILCIMLWCL